MSENTLRADFLDNERVSSIEREGLQLKISFRDETVCRDVYHSLPTYLPELRGKVSLRTPGNDEEMNKQFSENKSDVLGVITVAVANTQEAAHLLRWLGEYNVWKTEIEHDFQGGSEGYEVPVLHSDEIEHALEKLELLKAPRHSASKRLPKQHKI